MSHTEMAKKRTTMKTPRAPVHPKLCSKTNIKILTCAPKGILFFPLHTQHIPKHCCRQIQRIPSLKLKRKNLFGSTVTKLSLLLTRRLTGHLWERKLCNCVIMSFIQLWLSHLLSYKSMEWLRWHNLVRGESDKHSQKTW